MQLLHSEQGRWEQGLVQSFDVLSGKLREESKQRQKDQISALLNPNTTVCYIYSCKTRRDVAWGSCGTVVKVMSLNPRLSPNQKEKGEKKKKKKN